MSNTRHGFKGSRFYRIWEKIKSRCDNPNAIGFKYWGGRGIKCEWNSFEEFKNDMYGSYKAHVEKFGEKYTSIDRIETSGNYKKDNCRWATPKVQARNQRSNNRIEFEGKIHCISEWAEIYGIPYKTFFARLYYSKWPFEKAITK